MSDGEVYALVFALVSTLVELASVSERLVDRLLFRLRLGLRSGLVGLSLFDESPLSPCVLLESLGPCSLSVVLLLSSGV